MLDDINELTVWIDERLENIRIVQVSGELDAKSVRDTGIEEIVGGAECLVLDLTRCWFAELSGLTAFLKCVCQLSEDGVSVHLVARNESFIGQMLAKTSSYHRLVVHGTLSAAHRALGEERSHRSFS